VETSEFWAGYAWAKHAAWDTNWGDDSQPLHQSPTDHQVIRLQRLGLELPNPPEVARVVTILAEDVKRL